MIISRTIHLLFLILTLLGAFSTSSVCAFESNGEGNALVGRFHALEETLEKSSLGIPAHMESNSDKNSSSVDIYGVIDSPFDSLQKELSAQANWCDIILLHINVRACTHTHQGDKSFLKIYNVNKYSQPLEDASILKYQYQVMTHRPDYLDIHFTAAEGPYHSRDHKLRFEAAPADEHRTFVHLGYSYHYGAFGYIAMKSYYALFGGSRVGFSITGNDGYGNPIYASGMKGTGERNVMRYYLAILAYMDTLKYTSEQRFEKRVSRWYDLTARYKRQLFDMEKKEYLEHKRRDFKNQTMLQNSAKEPKE